MSVSGLIAAMLLVMPPVVWAQPEPTSSPAPLEPTSSKAPDSADDARGPADSMPAPTYEPTAADDNTSLAEERSNAKSDPRKRPFNRHGVGMRGGITVIPTWILSRYVASHTNSLCRGGRTGNFAEERGLLKTDGCNFYLGAEYVYRQSRVLDIVGSLGYQSVTAPEGYWLDKTEWNPGCTRNADGVDPSNSRNCNLSAADYTEVDLHLMFIEADFVARAPLVVTDTVEFGLGGGAGIGLGIVFGGVYQTPMGAPADGYIPGQGETTGESCQTLRDLADLQRCTPRWDPQEAEDGAAPPDLQEPNSGQFASCSRNNCSEGDLKAFGYRKQQDDVPPVIPVVNLIISTRVIVKDTFGITLNGGWNTGFYFGGALTYFFGKQFQKGGDGPSGAR